MAILGSWSDAGDVNDARNYHSATLLSDGRVLIVGGYSGSTSIMTAELYDPVIGSWSLTGSPIYSHSGHTGTLLLDGRVLVVGRWE